MTRTYDSLNADTGDDFGYGWRLEFVDTDLQTSLGVDETYEQLGIRSFGFQPGDKVYVTLPGGERETFTFSPIFHIYGGFFVTATGNGGLYIPRFVSESDSENTLTVPNTLLTRNSEGEFVVVSGYVYYPTDYILTTQSGIVYQINGNTGDLRSVRDTNDNILTFTNRGIESDTGVEVLFERDPQSRVVAVVDPAVNRVGYEYDAQGDLVAVTDREGNVTRFEYSDSRAHFLEEIIDPLERSGVRSEYDDSGRLSRLLDVNGEAVELVYDPDNSIQTVRDVFGNPTTYVYDTRGNVLTEVDALGGVIQRTYDERNNVLSETDPLRNTTSYTYDSRGNVLTETDPLENVIRYTYNSRGQVLSETDALGNTTTYNYDNRGNLLYQRDAAGNPTTFSYDRRGNLLSLVDAGGNSTSFSYDRNGNVVQTVDALENMTVYSYDKNGNQITSTQTLGREEVVTRSSYDTNGNLLSTTNPLGEVTRYSYNQNQQQTAMIDALGRKTEYRYDEKGQLIETIYPDNTPDTLADNPRNIALYDQGNRQRATIDDTYDYEAFGELIDSSGENENDYLFAGEQFDGGLGQYYLRQRYYEQGVGRFTRRDTYEGRINEPVTLHKYLYPNASPLNYIDPEGLYSIADAQAAISIANIINGLKIDFGIDFVNYILGGGEPSFLDIDWTVLFPIVGMAGTHLPKKIFRRLKSIKKIRECLGNW